MSILGTRVVRTEDPRLLTAGGSYTDDLRVPELAGAARVTFVRSPVGGEDRRDEGRPDPSPTTWMSSRTVARTRGWPRTLPSRRAAYRYAGHARAGVDRDQRGEGTRVTVTGTRVKERARR